MPSTQFSATDLKQLRQQLDAWRRSQSRRTPIPEPAWEAAATLARTHGVSRVAQILRLDFYKLRCRLIAAPPSSSPPGFVEIPWTSLTTPAGEGARTLGVFDAPGGGMRGRVGGGSPPLCG